MPPWRDLGDHLEQTCLAHRCYTLNQLQCLLRLGRGHSAISAVERLLLYLDEQGLVLYSPWPQRDEPLITAELWPICERGDRRAGREAGQRMPVSGTADIAQAGAELGGPDQAGPAGRRWGGCGRISCQLGKAACAEARRKSRQGCGVWLCGCVDVNNVFVCEGQVVFGALSCSCPLPNSLSQTAHKTRDQDLFARVCTAAHGKHRRD